LVHHGPRPAAAIKVASALFQDVIKCCGSGERWRCGGNSSRKHASWNATLKISKSITLIGSRNKFNKQSRGATGFHRRAGFILSAVLSADVPVRVSGIFFDNVVKADYRSRRQDSNRDREFLSCFLGIHKKIRVDHCKFSNGQRQLTWHNWAYGVVDHCAFPEDRK